MSLDLEGDLGHAAVAVGGVDQFARAIPWAWIEDALAVHGVASIRRRRLPAEQVVWLVLGMALLRNRPITEVCVDWDLALPPGRQGGVRPSSSALVQARTRLGEAPLRYLFLRTAEAWAAEPPPRVTGHRPAALGLRAFAVDGTVFTLPDSPENRPHFGSIEADGRPAAFPSARLVALMAVDDRRLWDAAIGPCTQGEVPDARALVASAPAHSITLFDRAYFSAELLLSWQQAQTECHWLTPAKQGMRYRVLETYGPQDELIEMPVSPQARQTYPHLPAVWTARRIGIAPPKGAIKAFLTSCTDPKRYPAKHLLPVYWQRWGIEQGFGEIKTRQLQQAPRLRSAHPTTVMQELWGILLAYNLVRTEMVRAAVEAKVEPLRMSFLFALRAFQAQIGGSLHPAPGALPKRLKDLRHDLRAAILESPKQKRPSSPRAVKQSKNTYPIKPRKQLEA